jgi:putative membrane protein
MNIGGNCSGWPGSAGAFVGAAASGATFAIHAIDAIPVSCCASCIRNRRWVPQVSDTTTSDAALGTLAERRAYSPETRILGQQIAGEQAMLHADFVRLATAQGIAVPAEPDERSSALRENLLQLPGQVFDRGFTMAIVHHTGVMLRGFDGGIAVADPALKDLANRYRPVVERERAASNHILDRIGGPAFAFSPDAGAVPPFMQITPPS